MTTYLYFITTIRRLLVTQMGLTNDEMICVIYLVIKESYGVIDLNQEAYMNSIGFQRVTMLEAYAYNPLLRSYVYSDVAVPAGAHEVLLTLQVNDTLKMDVFEC